jgi:hypothetical protein
MKHKLRHRAGVGAFLGCERVIVRLAYPILDLWLAVQRHWAGQVKLHHPQVIQAKHVVSVLVRVKHRVNDADLFAEQLFAHVGRRINE